jgi:hypothetical protein
LPGNIYKGGKFVIDHPQETIDGLAYAYKALFVPGSKESKQLADGIASSIQAGLDEFAKANTKGKAKAVGKVLGDIVITLVAEKGINKVTDALKAIKNTKVLTDSVNKIGEGTAQAKGLAKATLEGVTEVVSKIKNSLKTNVDGIF